MLPYLTLRVQRLATVATVGNGWWLATAGSPANADLAGFSKAGGWGNGGAEGG